MKGLNEFSLVVLANIFDFIPLFLSEDAIEEYRRNRTHTFWIRVGLVVMDHGKGMTSAQQSIFKWFLMNVISPTITLLANLINRNV